MERTILWLCTGSGNRSLVTPAVGVRELTTCYYQLRPSLPPRFVSSTHVVRMLSTALFKSLIKVG